MTRSSGVCEKIHSLCGELAARGGASIMEVCGTHTMAIARSGLRDLLPASFKLISGPGCPVCVTDQSYMDQAVYLARGGHWEGVGGAISPLPVIATYGDMVRVPGRHGSLAEARAQGARVEVVYSADQAVELAMAHPAVPVVFLGVGFETTAPATAVAVLRAQELNVSNFSVLTAHKLVLPALRALLSMPDVRVDGFLCPGHVSVILGYGAYRAIARDFGKPCVVAGFDPGQILAGIVGILEQLMAGKPAACTVYPPVSAEGNVTAQNLLARVFEPSDAPWRALGVIPGSGMSLREEFARFDAAKRFSLPELPGYEMPGCRCGDVLCGRCRPAECKLFGTRCTPRDPVGPCMVSSEGSCAAAYKYERRGPAAQPKR